MLWCPACSGECRRVRAGRPIVGRRRSSAARNEQGDLVFLLVDAADGRNADCAVEIVIGETAAWRRAVTCWASALSEM
jgi:hypothetical protein